MNRIPWKRLLMFAPFVPLLMASSCTRLQARSPTFGSIGANPLRPRPDRGDAPPDERIDSLRQHNLVYDQDDNGEFPHAYTDTFDGRFFFEFVQRIGEYQQYGAANAAVRMAAQGQKRPFLAVNLTGYFLCAQAFGVGLLGRRLEAFRPALRRAARTGRISHRNWFDRALMR